MYLPDFMIYQSFRYVLGRRTYAVGMWCDWAVENWERIPEHDKLLIKKELNEAFKRDEKERKKTGKTSFLTLGDRCDRAQWDRVRELYANPQNIL